jgi:hypothetical protein
VDAGMRHVLKDYTDELGACDAAATKILSWILQATSKPISCSSCALFPATLSQPLPCLSFSFPSHKSPFLCVHGRPAVVGGIRHRHMQRAEADVV